MCSKGIVQRTFLLKPTAIMRVRFDDLLICRFDTRDFSFVAPAAGVVFLLFASFIIQLLIKIHFVCEY